jgi:SAM-dependent methyltransferase
MVAACAATGTRAAPDTRREAPSASALPAISSTPAGPSATPSASAAPSSSASAAAPSPPASATAEPRIDVVYWATPQEVVDKLLELAEPKASDVIYDLGCGDARSLVTAAQRYGARGFGFDIDPRRVEEARENVRRHGVEHLVRIEQADIFTLDLRPANIVFLFLLPRLNVRLMPQLAKLRPGSRIVSHEFSMAGAKPNQVAEVLAPADGPPGTHSRIETHQLYLWKVPWQKQRKVAPTE